MTSSKKCICRSARLRDREITQEIRRAFVKDKSLSIDAQEGAATGAGTGAVIGGALGWLAGIGLLAVPGVGPFIAAGPIMAALAGVGAGGLVGGIAGALIGMGIPEYEANRYEGRIKAGGILLSIHADDKDWTKKGKDILKRTGAEEIGSKGESHADYDVSDRPGTGAPPRTGSGEPVEPRTNDPLTSNTRGPERDKL